MNEQVRIFKFLSYMFFLGYGQYYHPSKLAVHIRSAYDAFICKRLESQQA